jgi:putative flavoprotein involved in K+ transport
MFEPDLQDSLTWGDQKYSLLGELFDTYASEAGIPKPELPQPAPLGWTPRERLDLKGFAAVVFAGGFRPDYESWVHVPDAFDAMGFPIHEDGASTAVEGLHFVGVHFLRKRKSSSFTGVCEDAPIVAGRIAEAHGHFA